MTSTYEGRPARIGAAHPNIIPEENPVTDTAPDDWYTQHLADLAAADWHNIPAGHYAIPVVEDDIDDDHPHFCRVLGYKVFERKTPRVDKNGRRTGKNSWTRQLLLAPGVQWPEFNAYLDRTKVGDGYDGNRDILEVLEDPEVCMRVFGGATGRCGACGKTLTDETSKALGIGPECRRMPGPRYSDDEIVGAVRDAVETTEPGDTARTWTWERPIQGRARKREKVTVSLHPDAVPQSSHRSSREVCSTVLDRLASKREPCADPVVWSVRRVGARGAAYGSYYCDADLPAEYRPDGAPAALADQSALF